MYNYSASIITSFIAMAIIMVSYFVKKKELYLSFQTIGIVFLVLSYLFVEQYFAMASLTVALTRTITFFVYEMKNKVAPVYLSFLFSGLTVAVFIIINFVIFNKASWIDIIWLVSISMYAFTFRIRNLKTMRYVTIIPSTLANVYNIIIKAPIFSTLSYLFEWMANITAIIYFNVLAKKALKNKEEKNEEILQDERV